MCRIYNFIKEKKIPGYPGLSRCHKDKIPGFLIPGSWTLNYPGIKKSRDWNFLKIPGVNDCKYPGILASLPSYSWHPASRFTCVTKVYPPLTWGFYFLHGGLLDWGRYMVAFSDWRRYMGAFFCGNDNEYDNGMAASLREWQWRPFFGYDNGGLSLDMITVAPLWITILQRWYGSAGHVWLDPHLLW